MFRTDETHGGATDTYQKIQSRTFFGRLKSVFNGSTVQQHRSTNQEPFDHLKANLLSRCAKNNIKSIMFNGIHHGCGCSMIALNFASSLSSDSSCKVLLVDFKSESYHIQHVNPHIKKQNPDLADLRAVDNPLASQIKEAEPGNLYTISCQSQSLFSPAGLITSSIFERFIRSVYDKFDYLVIDAPPILINAEFRILCAFTDTVVLVVESEKSRRQVAYKARTEIEAAGGWILGVVINRRNYYIPSWIYQRF